jgi:hypothetical protein
MVWSVQKARAMVDDATTVVVFTDHNSTLGIAEQTNLKKQHASQAELASRSCFAVFKPVRVGDQTRPRKAKCHTRCAVTVA